MLGVTLGPATGKDYVATGHRFSRRSSSPALPGIEPTLVD